MTTLHLPDVMFEAIGDHARAASPNECCGLLSGLGGIVTRHFPLINELHSPTAYSAEARGLIDAFRQMRRDGTDLLAIYHSHPDGNAIPSRRDIEDWHYPDAMMVIVGEAETAGWWVRDGIVEAGIIREIPSSSG